MKTLKHTPRRTAFTRQTIAAGMAVVLAAARMPVATLAARGRRRACSSATLTGRNGWAANAFAKVTAAAQDSSIKASFGRAQRARTQAAVGTSQPCALRVSQRWPQASHGAVGSAALTRPVWGAATMPRLMHHQARTAHRPRATVVAAWHDPLFDDAVRYAAHLRSMGAEVEELHALDMPHGFMRHQGVDVSARYRLDEALAAFAGHCVRAG